ncbi:MAG: CotH kinase family protein [Bacteroidota bacterium]
MRSTLFALFLSFSFLGTAQELVVNIANHQFGVDDTNALIVARLDDLSNYDDLTNYESVIVNLHGTTFQFTAVPAALTRTQAYPVTASNGATYTLYFTSLPIIHIDTDNTIVDEPKVLAQFTYADEEQVLTSNIGIEIRGGFSQTFPKKTYDLEFWNDETGDDSDNVQFRNMRNDDDWILDALYNEPLRLRSHTAHKLWLDLHTPSHLDQEPNARAGADVTYVEVFLLGQYNGLYNLSEEIDRKQLQIKKFDGTMRGQLHKGIGWGTTLFSHLPSFDNSSREWGGHKFEYPKADQVTDWQPLYDFTSFVITTSNTSFSSEVWNRFDRDNFADYFLYLNVLRAIDNTGKNIYVAKYDTHTPFFYVPWDLDACFGASWDGSLDPYTEGILENGFLERVRLLNPDDAFKEICNRWFDLRGGRLSAAQLANDFASTYHFLRDHKLYEREARVYPNYPFDEAAYNYLQQWLSDRLAYLDTYFENTLNNTQAPPTVAGQVLYPNPADHVIFISPEALPEETAYQIYNSLGQLAKTGHRDQDVIPVTNLRSGTYWLLLGEEVYPFVKK